MPATYPIRILGDPVLRRRAPEVTDLDGTVVRLARTMVDTMYDASGVGLAAPQVGVQKRLFTYDVGDGPNTIVNPEVVESSGERLFDEGCLSIPGISLEVLRAERVTVSGLDLDGHEVVIEDDDYLARVVLHELDHLDGVLILDRVEPGVRKAALKVLREQDLARAGVTSGPSGPRAVHGDGRERRL